MITEEQKQLQDNEKTEARKYFLKQVIKASSKYERLMSNSDFLAMLKDLQGIVDTHRAEIDGYTSAYASASSIFRKMRIMEVISQHEIRRQQIQEAINYPQSLIDNVSKFREEYAKLTANERGANHD